MMSLESPRSLSVVLPCLDEEQNIEGAVRDAEGAALRSGFAHCTKDLVFFTDADRQFDPRELGQLIRLIGSCRIVAGFRLTRQDHLLRRINSSLWTTTCNFVLGFTARDANCAFKLFRRSALSELGVKGDGASINAELLARARRRGFVIREIGVHHYPRRAGRPTGARPNVIFKALRDLVKLRFELMRERYDA